MQFNAKFTIHELQVAVKKIETAGASAVVVDNFLQELYIAQLASATCQRACRMLGCCKLDTGLCLVMSLYSSSAARRLDLLQGEKRVDYEAAQSCTAMSASVKVTVILGS